MTPYADYDYYKDTYKGKVMTDVTDFDEMAQKASVFLRYYTGNKIKDPVPDDVKDATCAIADSYYTASKAISALTSATSNTSNVKSENTDGYAVTYTTAEEAAKQAKELESGLKAKSEAIAREYLLHTGLLYRGVC